MTITLELIARFDTCANTKLVVGTCSVAPAIQLRVPISTWTRVKIKST